MSFSYAQPYIVVGAFIVRDEKILLIQENHAPDAGKWNLPAGKLDFGEDPALGATREAREESGLLFTPRALLGIHSIYRQDVPGEVHALRIIFSGDAEGDVTLEHGVAENGIPEISSYKWATPEEILAMDDATIRYHDLKDLVRAWQAKSTLPLTAVEHIVQS